ncbi:MAG: hypothetical protein K6G80_09910 [Treponema sp.]|nr:hypothetical protein [Treponema sp.]
MQLIYNIIAELCSCIISSCSEDFFVKYSCLAADIRRSIRTRIADALPGLFDGSLVCQLREEDCTDTFFKSLSFLIESFKAESDFFAVVTLTQVLDESLEDELRAQIAEYQREDFSVVLNTNRESTGIGLLPRCSCCWERKRRLSHYYNRMDNFLFNLLLMENAILGELIDKHFFLRPDLFPGFAERKSLKIAATPLRLERKFDVSLFAEDRVQYFKIDYQQDSEGFNTDNELVWQKILLAAGQKSDIIVFPEMLGNPATASYVSSRLKNLTDAQRKTIPSLIILPSFWDKRRNTVSILDKFGSLVCSQSKQNPFRVEFSNGGALEGIYSSLVVNIFHYEGIGRIAILICKDFLTTKYMEQLMRCFKLTLIIVPSFSTGSYDFRQSFDLCAHDDCNVVWINTCAALEKGKECNFDNIGYVRKRVSRNDDESQTLSPMPICGGAFSGTCTHDCMYYETIQGV